MIERSLMIAVLFKLSIIFAVGTPIAVTLARFWIWFPFMSYEIRRFGINWASAFAAMGLGLYLGLSFLTSLLFSVTVSAGYIFFFPVVWKWFSNYRLKKWIGKIFAKTKTAEH